METSSPTPAHLPQQHVVEFLRRYLGMAEKGELQSVVLGYVKTDNAAAIQSTPMSAITMNHLHMLLSRRVAREYDRAIAQTNSVRQSTGAGAVPESPRVEAALPRKVRREIVRRQKNLQKLAAKKAGKRKAAETVIRTAPAANGQATGK